MKRDIMSKSFTCDENNHFQVDKTLLFSETDRQRHELCIKLLDTVKHSVKTFKPSSSLACLNALDITPTNMKSSKDNLYDYFVEEDEHFPISHTTGNTPNTSTKQDSKVEIDIVVSGGGLKGYFMTGCSHILKHELNKQNISIRRIAGASAGAWVGLFMMIDFSTSNWLQTYYLCQERLHMTMHEAYEEMWPWIESHLPPNAYEICSGRLFISITEVTWFGLKNHMISEYKSNRDLFNACLASSTVPYLSLPTALYKFRDMWVVDGGVTNNTPIFPDLPRRVLVFRLTDVFYPMKLLIHPNDACIEALVVRGAIQMSRFLQGEASDSFSWVEYNKGSSDKNNNNNNNDKKLLMDGENLTAEDGSKIIRRSPVFRKVFNMIYCSLLFTGSIYVIVNYLEQHTDIRVTKHVVRVLSDVIETVKGLLSPLTTPLFPVKK